MNNMNLCIKFSLILCIIINRVHLSSNTSQYYQRLNEHCLKIVQCNCSMDSSNDELTIKCHHENSKLQIIANSDYITITCIDLSSKNFFKLLPDLRMGQYEYVSIVNCLLPRNVSIAALLDSLQITNYIILQFQNNNNKLSITKEYFNGLNGLETLILNIRSDHQIAVPEDLFANESLGNLTKLDFTSNLIELPIRFFDKLKNLAELTLGTNLICFTSGVFHNRDLHLNRNELENREQHMFKPVNPLKSLNLKNNNIEKLAPDVFEILTNLMNIDLSFNKFQTLPAGIFKRNINLKTFELTNNQVPMKSVPSQLFANLPKLMYVHLKCELNLMPETLFANSTNIEFISLSNNKFKALPEKVFTSQPLLKFLYLSQNLLSYLPENLFKNTLNLKALYLSHNNLSYLPDSLFQTTTNLMVLKIDHNNLKTISSHYFLNNRVLRLLDLSDNQITLKDLRFDTTFKYSHDVKSIILQNNHIESFPINIPFITNTLDLSYNNITFLNYSDFFSLRSYHAQVNLAHNQIQSIILNNVEKPLNFLHYKNMNLNNNPICCDCNLLKFVQFLKGQKKTDIAETLLFQTNDLMCHTPQKLKGRNVKQINPLELLCELDGKPCPINCNCWIRSFDKILIVNCSNSKLTSVPVLPIIGLMNLKGIELNLENNLIEQLPSSNQTIGYANVTRLNLAGNIISNIRSIHLPKNLMYLDLRRNNLSSLDTLIFIDKSTNLQQILLSENPWNCYCEDLPLLRSIQNKTLLFKDSAKMICANIPKLKYFYELQDLCPAEYQLYIILTMILCAIGLLVATVIAVYYKYNEELKIWLYARNMCLWFVTEHELDRNKKYDAFVSYSSKDEAFIFDYLIPELENGSPPFKLCIHERDWHIGEFIPDQIIRSVANSRRTIVVLSQNFIDSVWAKMEFKAAHISALYERRSRIIVIIYGDITDIDSLDKDLRLYLKMNTYLKYGDSRFWDKLRYAMPHSSHIQNNREESHPLHVILNDIIE